MSLPVTPVSPGPCTPSVTRPCQRASRRLAGPAAGARAHPSGAAAVPNHGHVPTPQHQPGRPWPRPRRRWLAGGAAGLLAGVAAVAVSEARRRAADRRHLARCWRWATGPSTRPRARSRSSRSRGSASNDKPVLIGGVVVTVALLAVLVGVVGVRRPRVALGAFLVLSLVAIVGRASPTGRPPPAPVLRLLPALALAGGRRRGAPPAAAGPAHSRAHPDAHGCRRRRARTRRDAPGPQRPPDPTRAGRGAGGRDRRGRQAPAAGRRPAARPRRGRRPARPRSTAARFLQAAVAVGAVAAAGGVVRQAFGGSAAAAAARRHHAARSRRPRAGARVRHQPRRARHHARSSPRTRTSTASTPRCSVPDVPIDGYTLRDPRHGRQGDRADLRGPARAAR